MCGAAASPTTHTRYGVLMLEGVSFQKRGGPKGPSRPSAHLSHPSAQVLRGRRDNFQQMILAHKACGPALHQYQAGVCY